MVGLETLVGYEVITPSRRTIRKVQRYSFNINLGAIASLELDSFGNALIPSSLVSTYALFVEDVLEVVSDAVIVHEAASSWIYKVTKSLEDVPDYYNEFSKLRVPITELLPPATFSGSAMELDWGVIPTFDDLKEFVNANPCKKPEKWTSIKVQSKSREEKFVTTKGKTIGGPSTMLNSLGAYLRYLDGESRDDFWQKVHERMSFAESRDGASFNTLFGIALSLGILLRRRVYFEASKHESGGEVKPYSSTPFIKERRTSMVSWLGAQVLLFYLRFQLKDIV